MMAAQVRKIGARLALVYIPEMDFADPRTAYPEERLARFCAEEKIDFIPTRADFLAAADRDGLYYPNEGHCTAQGYALIAAAVFKAVSAQGLTP